MQDFVRTGVKFFWRLLAVTVMLVAVVVQCARLLAPQVEEYRENFESYLNRDVGVGVKLGSVSAQWEHLRPQLAITDLQFVTSDDELVLSVESAVGELDLIGSILSMDLKFSQVILTNVSASLHQNKKGYWYLSGVDDESLDEISDHDISEDSLAELRLLLGVFLQGNTELENISLQFHFSNGRIYQPKITHATLRNEQDFHRLSAAVEVPSREASIKLVYEARGDSSNLTEFRGHGYLEVVDYPLQSIAAFFSESLSEKDFIHDGILNSKIWLQSTPENFLGLTGELNLLRNSDQKENLPKQIQAQIRSRLQKDTPFQLDFIGLKGLWVDRQTPAIDLGLRYYSQESALQLLARDVDVDYWSNWVLSGGLLPEKVETIISTLAPRGHITNLEVSIPLDDPMGFKLKGNIENASVEAWGGVPKVSGLNGYVESSALSGFVQINSDDGFLMHFPKVYDSALEFNQASGEVSWAVMPDDNKVIVHSGLLAMQGLLGEAEGYFYLDAPFKKKSRPSEFILQLGLRDSDVQYHTQLVPKIVSPALRKWLDDALVDGDVNQGSFLFSGEVGQGSSKHKSIQLSLDVSDATLNYKEGWPELNSLSATLLLDDTVLTSEASKGSLLNSQLNNVKVTMAPNVLGEGSILSVKGGVTGDADDGLYFLTDTPLVDLLGETFRSWQLKGPMSAAVDLQIPLTAGEKGGAYRVDVKLENNLLKLKDLNLTLDQVNGNLSYTTEKGINSEDMTAELWGKPFDFLLKGSRNKGTSVLFSGAAQIEDLAAWSWRPETLFLDGAIKVKGEVSIPSATQNMGHIALVSIKSDLVGATVDLPEPYGKADAAEARSFEFRAPIYKDDRYYQFNYQNSLFVNLHQSNAGAFRGSVSFNEKTASLPESGLLWAGELGRVDVETWLSVLPQYQIYVDRLAARQPSAAPVESNTFVQYFDLQSEVVQWAGWSLDAVKAEGSYRDGVLDLNIDDDVVRGNVKWFEDNRPVTVDLKSIQLANVFADELPSDQSVAKSDSAAEVDQTNGAESNANKLNDEAESQIDFSEFVEVNFSVDDIQIDGEPFGRWSFQLRPSEEGLAFNRLSGDVRGAKISDATLLWGSSLDTQYSRFEGLVSFDNTSEASKAWRRQPVLESESAQLGMDLKWLGSPTEFDLLHSRGEVRVNVDKGRLLRNPSGQGGDTLMRLVGLVNVDTWVRRLKLDFSDLVESGMNFDSMEGLIGFDNGRVYLSEPISVKTTSAKLQLGGDIDLNDNQLDMSLVATLPVSNNAAVITAFAVSLPAAAGLFVISKLFKKQVDRVASLSYGISGNLDDPEVKFNKLFDNKSAGKASDRSTAAANQRILEQDIDEQKRRSESDKAEGVAAEELPRQADESVPSVETE